MREAPELDSKSLVLLAPYCNGRATGSNKVITNSQLVV
jgi:hypothetical protein